MTMERVVVHKYTCDGCGSEHIVEPDDELPFGFHGGSVGWVGDFGGTGIDEWFACKEACIKKAIQNLLDKTWEH